MFKQTKPIICIKWKKKIIRNTLGIILLKHKKSSNLKVNRRELAPKEIADKLLISDRVDQLQENEAYITVKDHKESFPHNPPFRLTNSSKADIGKISETVLD